MSPFLESMRTRAINQPIAVIGSVLILEHGYTIASQAIGDHTTALQVAREPCFGHSAVSSGDEGCVKLEGKSPTDAINREQQMLAILEVERPVNDRFGARHVGVFEAQRKQYQPLSIATPAVQQAQSRSNAIIYV
jgi:hypothetical protein